MSQLSIDACRPRSYPLALLRLLPHFAAAVASLCCVAQTLAQVPSFSPRQLAQEAVNNEVALIQYEHTFLRYRTHVKDSKGDQLRDVIESKDGTVARIIQRDERPLTATEDSDEHARLQGMLDSPSAFQKHIDKDRTGKNFAVELVRLLPEAMIFTYPPDQPQRPEKPAASALEIVLDFKPDPQWNPPTMASQALTGLEGRCWIDARTHHLTRLEADVFQPVNFGWGMLARIFPGGKFVLEQQPVSGDRWIVDHFVERVTLRAMLVKTVREDTDLFAFQFAAIPEMNYRDAIHLLLATPLPAPSTTTSR